MMRKFGRKTDHRNHLLRNLATSLILYETIDTTESKAKEIKSYVDRILARNKVADLNTIRRLNAIFFDKNAVKKIVDELIPRFEARTSGFITSFKLKNRLGDNSSMMRLELIDKKTFVNKDEKPVEKTVEPAKSKKVVKSKVEEDNGK